MEIESSPWLKKNPRYFHCTTKVRSILRTSGIPAYKSQWRPSCSVFRLEGRLRLTPALRLSDLLAPMRAHVDGIDGRLSGSPIAEPTAR